MKQILLSILFSVFALVLLGQENKAPASNLTEKPGQELKVYPNPCKIDKVTLEFQEEQIAEVHFVNLTGKEVLNEKYIFPVQKSIVQVKDLPNGIYIIRVLTSDQKTITQKLMVSRN